MRRLRWCPRPHDCLAGRSRPHDRLCVARVAIARPNGTPHPPPTATVPASSRAPWLSPRGGHTPVLALPFSPLASPSCGFLPGSARLFSGPCPVLCCPVVPVICCPAVPVIYCPVIPALCCPVVPVICCPVVPVRSTRCLSVLCPSNPQERKTTPQAPRGLPTQHNGIRHLHVVFVQRNNHQTGGPLQVVDVCCIPADDTNTHIHTLTRTHTHTHTLTHTYARTRTHTHTHMRNTLSHTHSHTLSHTHHETLHQARSTIQHGTQPRRRHTHNTGE